MLKLIFVPTMFTALVLGESEVEFNKFSVALTKAVTGSFQNTFNFVVLEDGDKLKEASEDFLRIMPEEFSYSTFTNIDRIVIKKDSLVLTSSAGKLEESFAGFLDNSFDFKKQFLVALTRSDQDEINSLFDFFWRKKILNVKVLYQMIGLIFVATYNPFTETSCSDTTPIIIDQFVNNSFFSKFHEFEISDLKACPLRCTTFDMPPIVMFDRFANNSENIHGSDIAILQHIAKALNFKVEFSFIIQSGGWFSR